MVTNSDTRSLIVEGARENNLRDLSLRLPHEELVVISGVSGSGKSTLAFDTLYAEGARRYIETFSPYTRQFLDRLHQPDIDRIEGVRPALALEQKNRTTSSRSTVGTATELNDYLKVVWANIGVLHCPTCGTAVRHDTPPVIARELCERVSDGSKGTMFIAFRIVRSGDASLQSLYSTLLAEGFVRTLNEATWGVEKIEELVENAAQSSVDELLVVVDRIPLDGAPLGAREKVFRSKLVQTLAQAYHYGHGSLEVHLLGADKLRWSQRYQDRLSCGSCGSVFRAPRPSAFTFNSPLGACDECNGFGRVLLIDPRKVIPDDTKSIADGAISCWNTETRKKQLRELEKFCAEQEIDTSRPWRKLSEKERQLVFNGAGKKGKYRGINGFFEKLKSKRRHLHVRVFLSRYRSEAPCPICEGGRLKREALHYFIEGRSLRDIWFTPVRDLIGFFSLLLDAHRGNEAVEIALEEVDGRLRYLADIGLGYLTLDRQTRTLSGGEHQRVNLTSLLGSRLVNTTIVLDEPTIALHPRDTARLLRSLESLRDRGNSVFVVEHDSEMIAAADEVVDLGPLSGSEGGTIVYQGPVSGLRKSATSLTGKYLSGALRVTRKSIADIAKGDVGASLKKRIRIEGARANNLRKVDVEIPLECFVVVTGVSGSGKSSLVTDAFFQTYDAYRESIKKGTLELDDDAMVRRLSGLNQVDEVVLVDQSPVGKTPRSNPGTYTKAWEIVRECLADTEDAKRLGLGKSAFSFNVAGGRCPQCEGAGYQRIEMQFLADVFVECEGCGGSRFQDEVLSVRLAGKNVGEILDLTLNEVVEYCGELEDKSRAEKILQRIRPLVDLGLGYLKMGQPLSELSGGEAQRVKLASYVQEGKQRCLFILDEPTTGLHPHNVQALLTVCDRLIEAGHSLLCVEHNMDVIRNADWMIDLGPDGGEDGGQIVLTGNPQQLLADSSAVQRSLTLQECLRADGMERDQHKSVVRPKRKASPVREIRVVGAKEHNLKDVTISIPQDKVTVITGVSGSGKSTLAFDILFQEGQRRYIDCLSPYARQYITQVRRADVERVDHIPPTVAISQKTAPPVGISTIATTTELYQYLRLLYSKAGEQRCPEHGEPITGLGAEELTEEVLRFGSGERLFLYAPAISERKGVYADLFERALRAEITEARIDGVVKTIQPGMRLERQKLHTISLLVGSIQSTGKNRDLVRAAMKQALLLGSGTVEVSRGTKDATPRVFSTERVCPVCRRGFHELDPRDFSFRSLRGMCETCEGRGKLGEEGGIRPVVQCPDCLGARIQELGRNVFIGEKSIDALCAMNAAQLRSFLLGVQFAERMAPVVKPLLKELTHRLEVIDAVGLGYLTLNREASTISGGEAQRLRLARTLGSPLSGICYVFDEPTIGLHPKDHDMLMSIIFRLRDSGNTVVIVEHDEETICQADHVIDVGPFGGRGGGRILADGPLDDLLRSEESVTAQALRERIEAEYAPPVAAIAAVSSKKAPLRIEGATTNNLKDVTASIPFESLTVVCGVSGAGKSSLVHGTLVPAVIAELEGKKAGKHEVRNWKALKNASGLERLLEIDQSPVGKNAASTPASYLGIFDEIRKIFALLPESQARGWNASFFSFNSGKGKCSTCAGRGVIRVPMSFLPEAQLDCEECGGSRYSATALEVLYQGYSIGDILRKTMTEAKEIFTNHSKVRRMLAYIEDLGLGYLSLGQPTHTLSGGEAQRLKIARELGAREAVNTLYVLDEPTIGLHMVDVERLVSVLRKLIEKGNTVVLIEHNLDVVTQADQLIELGPGPGAAGGEIVFEGTPRELLAQRVSTATAQSVRSRSDKLRQLWERAVGHDQPSAPSRSNASSIAAVP